MPGAKHGDPQVGIDIHLCVVPPGTPAPLPTPHTSVVFDPFDYVPYIGATVTVCGMKRATAGTEAKVIHIPPGFPFSPKLPSTDDEIFMGSSTVLADGEPFSFTSVPTLSCQVAGMISPPRLKKKGPPKAMVLPTTVNLAIPTSVFVGGPPTISLLGMAFKFGFAALGRFARSGVFRRFRQRVFRNLDAGFLKCRIFRAEPVNILSGEVSVEHEDFTLPGRIPIEWRRTYSSGNQRAGLCGYGWETPADIRLELDSANSTVSMIHPSQGPLFFERLPLALGNDSAELELMDGALLSDHGNEYQVRTKEDRIYRFPKDLARISTNGAEEYPLSRIADFCGNWLDFERVSGRLTGIRESAGRFLPITIKNGRIQQIALQIPGQDQNHIFVKYQFDNEDDLTAVLDPYDHPYTFEYEKHRMVRHTDRNGLSFYYRYEKTDEGEWRVIHAWGDGGLYDYKFEYFDAINERRITDSLGHTSIVKLNEAGLPISEIDPLGGMTIFEYDERGRTTVVVDQDGNRTEYEYDERGNLLELTRPDGNCVQTEFNLANKATKITDPNCAEWQQEWNDLGLLTRQVSPLEAESRYEYDTYGQLVGFTNPKDAPTGLSFDAYGNLTQLTDALNHATSFDYDVLGNVVTKIDPLKQHTAYSYDLKGRLNKATLPSGAAIACAYDHEDNLTRYVDENGAETRLEYFGQGEIKRRIQPDGHSVEYHYDIEERLIGVTNQRGERYELIRDPLGRIFEEIDYWGQGRRYSYTGAGYLKESVDPLGRVIQYETDPLGRITKKLLPGTIDPDAVQTESFEYDANGNLVVCENAAIRTERSFDDESRMLEERQGTACKITNAYDLNGNRISRGTEVNIGERHYANTVQYEFDTLDQAIGVEVEDHDPLQLTRNGLGQVIEESLSNHVRRDFAYSPDGYLTAQRVIAAEGPLIEQNFRYDRAGNLTEKRDSVMGVDRYTYDPLGRLVSHLNPESSLTKYLNDPTGDRLRTRISQNTTDERSPTDWTREGEYEGVYYRFDKAGNLIERSGPDDETCFTWDSNQRLSESCTNGKVTIYQYDPLGRRVGKETDGILTNFFWDGDALLGDILVEEDKTEALASSLLREWVYYPETFEPLVMVQDHGASASEIYLYHNDLNGCPTRLLDAGGDVVWAAQYSAWGGVEKLVVDRVDNPIRLQGQYCDREAGLYYNRYRYYDPCFGCFVSQDPIGLLGGSNFYFYAPNIWGWSDPLGLECIKKVDPNELNFSQRTINRRFDTPSGKQKINQTIRNGPDQVQDFPPVTVREVDGQLVVIDGNSRTYVAQRTGAKEIRVRIDQSPEAGAELNRRTRRNNLPRTGTSRQPEPK